MNKSNKRRLVVANKLHRDIIILIFLASVLPAVVVAICLYFLIFNVTAQQVVFPEGIAYNIIPAAKIVFHILSIATPFSVIVILLLSYSITHKIVGPFDRILRELDDALKGKKQDHIVLRKNDKFLPLVERINKLLDRLYKK